MKQCVPSTLATIIIFLTFRPLAISFTIYQCDIHVLPQAIWEFDTLVKYCNRIRHDTISSSSYLGTLLFSLAHSVWHYHGIIEQNVGPFGEVTTMSNSLEAKICVLGSQGKALTYFQSIFAYQYQESARLHLSIVTSKGPSAPLQLHQPSARHSLPSECLMLIVASQ